MSVENSFLGSLPDVQCMCCGQCVVEIKYPFCAYKTSFQEEAH